MRTIRPGFVLELGSGISTLIIGHALAENRHGILISMEENKEYGQKVLEILGKGYPVEMHIEPAIEDFYMGFRGHRYRLIPQKPFDFIFIDGPRTTEVDLDAFYVLENCSHARVIIDNRKKTFAAFQSKFPARFNKLINIGYINYA